MYRLLTWDTVQSLSGVITQPFIRHKRKLLMKHSQLLIPDVGPDVMLDYLAQSPVTTGKCQPGSVYEHLATAAEGSTV